jgi:hemolysin activation/secretion protein
MKKTIGIGLFAFVYLAADPIAQQIDDVARYQEQKRLYEAQHKEQQRAAPIYTDMGRWALQRDGNGTGACIQTDRVDTSEITLINDHELSAVTAPYLHRCNSIVRINNLIKQINNLYIQKAYVTSRAYLKAQDLSKGVLHISTMEGKIESLEGRGVFTKFVFPRPQESYLNLRDLEVGIEQLNRLKSYQTKMAINPGSKVGYSQIIMKGTRTSFPIHGTLGVNNFGTEKSGKYQLSGSLEWENMLGANDLLSLSYNTTDKQDEENDSEGYSISYGLPFGKNYLKMVYSKFDYSQIVNGLNTDYESKGKSKSFKVSLERKLFHRKQDNGKIDISLEKKKSDNYLAGEYLATSSSTLTIFKLAYTHKLISQTWDGYYTGTYHQGLDWLDARTGPGTSPEFKKITLDINYNKRFIHKDALPATYNFSFHGQYAKKGIIGSQQIGVGRPYSVRGFKSEGSLSGNMGFYVRNELSVLYQADWGTVSPYLAIDFGGVESNEKSHGGKIIGNAAGVRVNTKGFALDLFVTRPIYNSNKNEISPVDDEIHTNGQKFFGFNLSYQF